MSHCLCLIPCFVFAEYSWPNFYFSSVSVWHAELADPSSHKLLNLDPSLALNEENFHKRENEKRSMFLNIVETGSEQGLDFEIHSC